MVFLTVILAAYLVGAIPFAYILARAHGKDVRSIGSGNIGATNLARALGRTWGYVCFVLDVLKGLVPMLVTLNTLKPIFLERGGTEMQFLWLWLAVGGASVLGHIFPVYLGFKGGKGVSTSLGVGLGLWPYYTVCAALAFGVWVVVVLIWRYVSLASMVAAISFPLIFLAAIRLLPGWELSFLWPLLVVATIIPVMVILLHRTNIARLRAGKEHRVLQSNPSKNGPPQG
jgi:acyl phosphate:glycerol-3-phosphate acyltransferase